MAQTTIVANGTDSRRSVRTWRIHLGAHKTATTHLQDTLCAVRPRLATQGIDYIPRAVLRDSGFAHALNRRRLDLKVPGLRRYAARQIADGILAPLRAGHETLILSEENLLGASRHVFADRAYPLVEHVVPLLAGLGGSSRTTFFLSIRSFDTHLPSAYAQDLRERPPPEDGFASVRRRVAAVLPSWFRIVSRVRRAAPGVPIRVWRYEDYRYHQRRILAGVCGRDLGLLPDIPVPRSTQSPTEAGVRAAEALPRDLPPAERKALVDAIYADHRDSGRQFRPFTLLEEQRLRAAYEADLARIACIDSTVLLPVE